MMDEQEFRKLSYEEQLHLLMLEAQKEHDIYAMLIIHDKQKELRKKSMQH